MILCFSKNFTNTTLLTPQTAVISRLLTISQKGTEAKAKGHASNHEEGRKWHSLDSNPGNLASKTPDYALPHCVIIHEGKRSWQRR
jgi:hypothetical protein